MSKKKSQKEEEEGEQKLWQKIASKYDSLTVSMVGHEINTDIHSKLLAIKDLGHVLEIGSGTGFFSGTIIKNATKVVGLDISSKMTEVARERHKDCENLEYVVGDCKSLPFEKDTFDSVIILNVLHMINEPIKAVEESHRVLKENGRLYVISYNSSDFSKFKQFVTGLRFIKTYGFKNATQQKKYAKFFDLDEFAKIINGVNGMELDHKEMMGKNNYKMKAVYLTATKQSKTK